MIYRFAPFDLDALRFELRRDGAPVPIAPKAFDLLHALVERPDVVWSQRELLERVWPGVVVGKDSLVQAVRALRAALGDDPDDARYIHTMRGRGYRFAVNVERVAPLPEPADAVPFVGRGAELRAIAEHLARARSGSGGVVLVTGDAGAGKTALLHEACARANGARAAVAGCRLDEGAPALWPLGQILRRIAGDAPLEADLAALAAGELEPKHLAAAARRFRVFDCSLATLARAAKSEPLLLAFDDVDAADPHLLAFLSFAAERLRSEPIVVLASYRHGRHDGRFEVAIGAIACMSTTVLVRLQSLAETDVAALVARVIGSEPSPRLVAKLCEKTAGNPLLLMQLAPVLRAREWLGHDPSTSALVGGDSMREAIAHQLVALSESSAHVITMAAVFGRSFALAPLAAALGSGNEAVMRELDGDDLRRIVVRVRDGGYRFAYPLVRDVLYQRIDASDRARLHASAARALEDHLGSAADHQRVGEIARHLVEAAAIGQVDAAVDWSLRAFELARAAGDVAAARRHAEGGLAALGFAHKPDPERRARLEAAAHEAQVASRIE